MTETSALSSLLRFAGVTDESVTDALLSRFGSLSAVLSSDRRELIAAGLSERAAILIQTAASILARSAEDQLSSGTVFDRSEKLAAFFVRRYLDASVERVSLLLLDSDYRPLTLRKIAEGAINSAAVEPRRIAEEAVFAGASYAVLAHNHPRGLPIPSRDDEVTTALVSEALSTVGVLLIEHYLVAGNTAVPVCRLSTTLTQVMPESFYT